MNFTLIFSSIVELNKLTPLSAEKHILDKFYGRTKRFTNAVNEMKTVLQNMSKEKEKEREEEKNRKKRARANKKDDEQRRLIERVSQRVVKIVLTKLKPDEIESWASHPPKFSMALRKR